MRKKRNLTSFCGLRVLAAQELLAPLIARALFLGCTVPCKIDIIFSCLEIEEMLILYMCSFRDVEFHRRDWGEGGGGCCKSKNFKEICEAELELSEWMGENVRKKSFNH